MSDSRSKDIIRAASAGKPDSRTTKTVSGRISGQLGFESMEYEPGTEGLSMLEGTLSKVVFSNPESGWLVGVLTRSTNGMNDDIKIVGFMGGIREGAILKVWGKNQDNKKHGPQFSVERFVEVSPNTKKGILKYLSSGLVEGIGRGMAQRIVDRFGEETVEIIENQPQRLTEVEGIGLKRSRLIKKAFSEKKALRSTIVFLQGHGLNMGQAQKVFKKYGSDAINQVSANPYRLVTDIQGIGFLTADRMAINMGISPDAPQRIEAGLLYTLTEAGDKGHCFLPEDVLVKESVLKLQVEEDMVKLGIEKILEKGWAVDEMIQPNAEAAENYQEQESNGKKRIIYPVFLHTAETETSRLVKRLLSNRARPLHQNLEKEMPVLQKNLGIEFSPAQCKALETSLEEKIVVITGGPGTGKTTLVKGLLHLFMKRNLDVAMAAPTGRAARRMKELTQHEAKTIHRLLEYTPHVNRFERNVHNPVDADVVIVDETSMVDIELFHNLLKGISADTRLILVGDADQLPSVGPGLVLNDIIGSGVVPTVRLTDIFRQARKSRIVMTAHRVNKGQPLDDGSSQTSSNLFIIEKTDPEEIIKLICKMAVERIPERFGMDPAEDIQILCPMKNGLLGTQNLNNMLRDLHNPCHPCHPVDTTDNGLRPGDKVMQIRNNYDKDVFNGDIGRVMEIDPKNKRFMVEFDGRWLNYENSETSQLTLAYACTIHKSQGSEYPAVIAVFHNQHYIMLQRNLLYTAITRARKLCVLIGQKEALSRAVQNASTRKRYTRLANRLKKPANSRSIS